MDTSEKGPMLYTSFLYALCPPTSQSSSIFSKNNRRHETRVDGSEAAAEDKVGLLTSAMMVEDLDLEEAKA